MSNKIVYSQWLKRGTNTFIPTDNSETKTTIEAGYYDIKYAEGIGYYLFKKEFNLDNLLVFPSNTQSEILNSIKTFWASKQKFIDYGFAFKRGILLHGKPGSGKTGIINLAIKHSIEIEHSVVLSLSSHRDLDNYASFMPEIFRMIEPHRQVIIIMEDVEVLCEHPDTETLLLNVLDGLDQLENVVYLATTNYIEKLKERIINRPSRFDRRIYVPFLTEADRLFYFEKKLTQKDLSTIDVTKWVKDTENMSIAHLGELVKQVCVFGNDYAEAIAILKEMNEVKNLHSSNYEKETKSMGFSMSKVQVNRILRELENDSSTTEESN